jgi:hypothetical protein
MIVGEIMKKNITSILITFMILLLLTGCSFSININTNKDSNSTHEEKYEEKEIYEMQVQINLESNETALEFSKLLPLTVNMNELNGNEKYVYLDKPLKTNPYNPKHIEAGDVMLYGNNCLVIFYKSFDTSYSYTKIGHIDNLPDLGDSEVNVKIDAS